MLNRISDVFDEPNLIRLRSLGVLLTTILLLLLLSPVRSHAENKVMGEVQFEGVGKLERDSGVWVDGQYVGYLKELKGAKKLLLLPGEHEIIVRQGGLDDFVRKIVVEPGQKQTLRVAMRKSAGWRTPMATAELKLTIHPDRAAVFLDDHYIGHVGEFGGKFHSVSIAAGKHRIKVELPGYRTFETELDLLEGQKSEVKTELVKGSIQQNDSSVKQVAQRQAPNPR